MSRPQRGNFEAWLRGGQTVGHTWDMTLEVIGRIAIVSAIWALVCGYVVNAGATPTQQTAGWITLEAWVLERFGPPLPQRVSLPEPPPAAGARQSPTPAQVASAAAAAQLVPVTAKPPPARSISVKNVWYLDELSIPAGVYWARAKLGLVIWIEGVLGILALAWFWFTRAGREKIKTSQVRGQEIDRLKTLVDEIVAFNVEQVDERHRARMAPLVKARTPAKASKKVVAEVWAQAAKDTAEPWTAPKLAGVPYPYETEMQHTMVVGAPGSGKTEAIHQLIESIRAKKQRAIIFDPELDYIRAHYQPEHDTILNPFDARSPGWSPFDDAADRPSWDKLGHAIFRDPKSGDPYWVDVARSLFSWTGYQLRRANPDVTLNEALDLLFGPTKALKDLLEGTPAAKHLNGVEGARVSSLESVLTNGVEPLIYLYGSDKRFSIREWTNRPAEKEGGFLFFSAPESHIDSIRPLLGFWAEIAVGAMLSRHDMERVPTWMILDEFHSAGKIDKLADGPQRLRKYGGAVVLGFQQMSQLQDLYGPDKSRTIIGQCQTKLILRAGDFDTAELMSEQIGRRVMRRVEENTSYGANSIRDGVGLAPKEELEPICLPEDVMNFPSLQGVIRVSNARRSGPFPVAPIRIAYIDRDKKTPGFVPKPSDPVDDYLNRLRGLGDQPSTREATKTKGSRSTEDTKVAPVNIRGGDGGGSASTSKTAGDGQAQRADRTTKSAALLALAFDDRDGNRQSSTAGSEPSQPPSNPAAAATRPATGGGPIFEPTMSPPANDDEDDDQAEKTKDMVARRKDLPTEEAERVRRREEEDDVLRRERVMADRRNDEAPMTRISVLQKEGEYLTDGVASELGLERWNNYSQAEMNYALHHRHDGLSDALGLIIAGVAGGVISDDREAEAGGLEEAPSAGVSTDDRVEATERDDAGDGGGDVADQPEIEAPRSVDFDTQSPRGDDVDLDAPTTGSLTARVRAALAEGAERDGPKPDRSLERDREIEMGR